MNQGVAKALEAMAEAFRTGELDRIEAVFEPNALLRAPFLSEPIRGWPAIASYFQSMVLPNLGNLEVIHTVEMQDQVLRRFESRFRDRDGREQVLRGEVTYTFSPAGKVMEASFFLDEANLRLLVLRRP